MWRDGQLWHNVVLVCPTHRCAQNNKENCITSNILFSVGMYTDNIIAKFDDSEYDVIVSDDI